MLTDRQTNGQHNHNKRLTPLHNYHLKLEGRDIKRWLDGYYFFRKQAKRFPHHYRCDESFHAYVVALVGSSFFKSFIMVAIVVNAVSLAVETGEVKTYHVVFDILDNLFLSIYLVGEAFQ